MYRSPWDPPRIPPPHEIPSRSQSLAAADPLSSWAPSFATPFALICETYLLYTHRIAASSLRIERHCVQTLRFRAMTFTLTFFGRSDITSRHRNLSLVCSLCEDSLAMDCAHVLGLRLAESVNTNLVQFPVLFSGWDLQRPAESL